ncbi:MAG: hypothetical protein WKF82_10700 [Nocardioidaceae bacterium]
MIVADTPLTWPDPPYMSTLEGLLIFVGIPLLITVIISILVMAPSLARGSQQTSGRSWRGQPEWFGAPRAISASEARVGSSQITTGQVGFDPAEAGAHDNVTSDNSGTSDATATTTGSPTLGPGRPVEMRSGSTVAGAADADETGGVSVRW